MQVKIFKSAKTVDLAMADSEITVVQPELSSSAAKPRKRKSPSDAQASGTKKTKAAATGTKRRPANNGFGRGKKAIENVHKLLGDLGIVNPESVSSCLKAGILNGSITLKRSEDDPDGEYGLDQVIVTGSCLVCGEEDLKCTLRDVLYQPDYGGLDYEDGGLEAPFKCKDEDCSLGIYVTGMCSGSPGFDTGKFHNHCRECPQFGTCIGDYREAHCYNCGKHYFAGMMGGPCFNCEGKKKGRGKGRSGGGGGGGRRQWVWTFVGAH